MTLRKASLSLVFTLVAVGAALAQQNGQPASDVLMQLDIWGNPTPRGGVTNSGPNPHSVW